jgi:hypothetical protein
MTKKSKQPKARPLTDPIREQYAAKSGESYADAKLRLEVQQLEFENHELSLKIENELSEQKNKFSQRVKNITAIVSTLVTLVTALALVWNAYEPIVTFLEKRSSERSVKLDLELKALFEQYESADTYTRRRLTLDLMTYYEDEALPYLFNMLNREFTPELEQEKNMIHNTIAGIYNLSDRKRSFDIISRALYQRINVISFADQIYQLDQYALQNNLQIYKRLKLTSSRKEELKEMIEEFKVAITNKELDPTTKSTLISMSDMAINDLK